MHDESIARLTAFAARRSAPGNGEFILLNKNRYNISATVTILGCTLWSALNADDLDTLSWSLNDLKRIDCFTPTQYSRLHNGDLIWLNTTVHGIRSTEPERHVIIFTHHAPTVEGTGDPKYAEGPTNSAFASELTHESCWGPPVTMWAFGHTHWTCDFVREGVRVMSNQRGYGMGDSRFDARKVVKLSG
jgi:hypothetical protein